MDLSLPFAPAQRLRARYNGADPMNGSVTFFVRSTGVTLHPASHDDGVGGDVLDVAFTGRGYEHVITLAQDARLTKIFSTRRFERGSNVKVTFEPSECFVMNTQEQEA